MADSDASWAILGPTAVCPGCNELVELPPDPVTDATPAALCDNCGAEVPDFRRQIYLAPAGLGAEEDDLDPAEAAPLSEQKFTRSGLFGSLLGKVAERGILRY